MGKFTFEIFNAQNDPFAEDRPLSDYPQKVGIFI